jgi:hypothetical protein
MGDNGSRRKEVRDLPRPGGAGGMPSAFLSGAYRYVQPQHTSVHGPQARSRPSPRLSLSLSFSHAHRSTPMTATGYVEVMTMVIV